MQNMCQHPNQCHIRKKLCLVSFLTLVLLVVCFFYANSTLQFKLRDQKLLFDLERWAFGPSGTPEPLLVLFWPNDVARWGSVEALFKSNESRCKFTNDTAFVNEADVLVHYVIYTPEELPKLQKINTRQSQSLSQLRIFFMVESPILYNFHDPSWNPTILPQTFSTNSYHWTFTYRQDSDIVASYGSSKPLPNSSTPPFSPAEIQRVKNHKMEIPQDKLETYIKKYLPQEKSKLIAWIVSHCKTNSKREELVDKLSEFIQVDIYGGCSGVNCSGDCYKTLGPQYKFYLSFENALCLDYVTEKFFKALKHDMIPIVYGGIDSEYERFAPPGSFIRVRDFPSVKQLALYLKFLDKNPKEYLKYFLWKEKYSVHAGFPLSLICDKAYAVSMVNEEGRRIIPRNYTRRGKVKDVSKWWFKGRAENGDEPVCNEPPTFI